MKFPPLPRSLAALASALLLAVPARAGTAATDISGALSGTLTSQVYHVTGSISVATGNTLTIDAGAVLKFNPGTEFDVDGTLLVNGTSGSPVIFTSIDDDSPSAGGDTNGGGPGFGSAGDWSFVDMLDDSSASVVDWLEIRYAGAGGQASLRFYGSDAAFSNLLVRDGLAIGMRFHLLSAPTINTAQINDCGSTAIWTPWLEMVPGLSNITATGNDGGAGNYVKWDGSTIASDVTLSETNLIDGVLVMKVNGANIAAARTLTLNEGVILKFISGWLIMNGTLICNGTGPDPVVFTTLTDDSHGGNTNGGAANEVGTPGEWVGIQFSDSSDNSSLDWTVVRYGGNNGNIALTNADITMTNSTVSDALVWGMTLGNNSFPTVSNCSFVDNGDMAVRSVPPNALPGFTGNAAWNNGGGAGGKNYLQMETSPTADLTITTNNLLSDPVLAFDTSATVPVGTTMTIGPGVILKSKNSRRWNIQGTLTTNGTLADPVTFTSIDDDVGYDSNNNGTTTDVGSPGDWHGIHFFNTASASALTYTNVSNGGDNNWANIYLSDADISMSFCTLRASSTEGMDCANLSRPSVNDCAFNDSATVAVNRVPFAAVPGFVDNTATGNGAGDYIAASNLDVQNGDSPTIQTSNIIGPTLVALGGGIIDVGSAATLEAGVHIKMTPTASNDWRVRGTLTVNGTTADPVVITSLLDDSVDGDTNKAAGLPAKGDWDGMWFFFDAVTTSNVDNLVLRYPWRGVYVQNGVTALDGVRVDCAQTEGFHITGGMDATRLTAWNCSGRGVYVSGGSPDISHVTATSNSGDGFELAAGYLGHVRNSISWGNTGLDYDGFSLVNHSYCNGSGLAAPGNIFADPLFVDEPAGDLNLQAGSPCIDSGDPASPLDPDCTRADMGAYYRPNGLPENYCTAGVSAVGCQATLSVSGQPSASASFGFVVSAANVEGAKQGQFYYGQNGRQANPWGNGTSRQCVAKPTKRGGNMSGTGTAGTCDGTAMQDLNARWCLTCPRPNQNPVVGIEMQIQYWYRDPLNTSSQTTSLSDAIAVMVCP